MHHFVHLPSSCGLYSEPSRVFAILPLRILCREASIGPYAGGAFRAREKGVAMDPETIYVLAAYATVGAFILEVIRLLRRPCRWVNAQRMARKEARRTAPEKN